MKYWENKNFVDIIFNQMRRKFNIQRYLESSSVSLKNVLKVFKVRKVCWLCSSLVKLEKNNWKSYLKSLFQTKYASYLFWTSGHICRNSLNSFMAEILKNSPLIFEKHLLVLQFFFVFSTFISRFHVTGLTVFFLKASEKL